MRLWWSCLQDPTVSVPFPGRCFPESENRSATVRPLAPATDEERNTEQAVRSTGQGRWSTGQQIGYKEYRKNTYDEETKKYREEGGVIDFTGDFNTLSTVEDTNDPLFVTESTFDEEGEAYNLNTIAEEGDGDDNDETYELDPIDN